MPEDHLLLHVFREDGTAWLGRREPARLSRLFRGVEQRVAFGARHADEGIRAQLIGGFDPYRPGAHMESSR